MIVNVEYMAHVGDRYLAHSQKQEVGCQKDDRQNRTLGTFMLRLVLVMFSTTLATASTAAEATAKHWKQQCKNDSNSKHNQHRD